MVKRLVLQHAEYRHAGSPKLPAPDLDWPLAL
jgi:hypothetical protein